VVESYRVRKCRIGEKVTLSWDVTLSWEPLVANEWPSFTEGTKLGCSEGTNNATNRSGIRILLFVELVNPASCTSLLAICVVIYYRKPPHHEAVYA